VADGSELWGEQYNRKLADILAVQEDIAREISRKLRLRLSSEEKIRLAKRYTENAEAYQLYLKGRFYSARLQRKASTKEFGTCNRPSHWTPITRWPTMAKPTTTALGVVYGD
jgi:hypothetical protein